MSWELRGRKEASGHCSNRPSSWLPDDTRRGQASQPAIERKVSEYWPATKGLAACIRAINHSLSLRHRTKRPNGATMEAKFQDWPPAKLKFARRQRHLLEWPSRRLALNFFINLPALVRPDHRPSVRLRHAIASALGHSTEATLILAINLN